MRNFSILFFASVGLICAISALSIPLLTKREYRITNDVILNSSFVIPPCSGYPQLNIAPKCRTMKLLMWFGRNTYKIKLSRRLKWSVGKTQTSSSRLWMFGGLCLVIAIGLTFNIFKSPQNSTEAAEPRVLGATSQNSTPAKVQFIDYQVQRGDTLFSISQKYNISWGTLAELNDLQAPFNLKKDQIIKVPIQ